jgi:hypothetical protein
MNIKKIVTGLLTALALSWTTAVYAQNATEFGIEGDLTVLGKGAIDPSDPDLEVKGFTVFGATQAAPVLQIPFTPGNVFVNGYVQVSSGMYVAGSSTFTATVNLPVAASMLVNDAASNGGKVLTSDGTTGRLKWGDLSAMVAGDNLGNHIATTTLNMMTFDVKNAGYITASSAALSGQLVVYGTSTLTGNTGVGGALNVTGDEVLTGKLNVAGTSTFVSSVTAQGDSQLGSAYTNKHGVNMAPAANTALSVAGQSVSGDYAAKFYSGATLSAWIKKK